jgi:hypothetical protein
MRWIGARTSDWHSGRADIRPGAWIGAMVAVLVLYVLLVGLLGGFVHGDGSPYLGGLGQ